MSENVLKFRPREKPPEPPRKKPRGPMPSWTPFVALVGLAVVIYLVGEAGLLG
jgi:hypothetical protein